MLTGKNSSAARKKSMSGTMKYEVHLTGITTVFCTLWLTGD